MLRKSKNDKAAAPPEKSNLMVYRLADEFSGRDEMNLAGNPFALLQADGRRKGETEIRYEWERTLSSGKIVTASWRVAGDGSLGLPGPSDELLYLVLLELTREAAQGAGFPQTVAFSRYRVMEQLGWSDSSPNYRLLADCFSRLKAVVITADHAFYDARTKQPFPRIAFNLIDEFAIADEARGRKAQGTLPLSWFKWSDVMHASFAAGNMRALALDFVRSLATPTARRLFRFLDMHRHATKPPRREFTIGLIKLRDHLGMVNLRYSSKIKERLCDAHTELQSAGYLAGVEYRKNPEGNEMVVYYFDSEAPQATASKSSPSTQPSFLAPLEPNAEPNNVKGLQICPQAAKRVYDALEEPERARLLEKARQGVAPFLWDRLDSPESPISLTLWILVAEEHQAAYASEAV